MASQVLQDILSVIDEYKHQPYDELLTVATRQVLNECSEALGLPFEVVRAHLREIEDRFATILTAKQSALKHQSSLATLKAPSRAALPASSPLNTLSASDVNAEASAKGKRFTPAEDRALLDLTEAYKDRADSWELILAAFKSNGRTIEQLKRRLAALRPKSAPTEAPGAKPSSTATVGALPPPGGSHSARAPGKSTRKLQDTSSSSKKKPAVKSSASPVGEEGQEGASPPTEGREARPEAASRRTKSEAPVEWGGEPEQPLRPSSAAVAVRKKLKIAVLDSDEEAAEEDAPAQQKAEPLRKETQAAEDFDHASDAEADSGSDSDDGFVRRKGKSGKKTLGHGSGRKSGGGAAQRKPKVKAGVPSAQKPRKVRAKKAPPAVVEDFDGSEADDGDGDELMAEYDSSLTPAKGSRRLSRGGTGKKTKISPFLATQAAPVFILEQKTWVTREFKKADSCHIVAYRDEDEHAVGGAGEVDPYAGTGLHAGEHFKLYWARLARDYHDEHGKVMTLQLLQHDGTQPQWWVIMAYRKPGSRNPGRMEEKFDSREAAVARFCAIFYERTGNCWGCPPSSWVSRKDWTVDPHGHGDTLIAAPQGVYTPPTTAAEEDDFELVLKGGKPLTGLPTAHNVMDWPEATQPSTVDAGGDGRVGSSAGGAGSAGQVYAISLGASQTFVASQQIAYDSDDDDITKRRRELAAVKKGNAEKKRGPPGGAAGGTKKRAKSKRSEEEESSSSSSSSDGEEKSRKREAKAKRKEEKRAAKEAKRAAKAARKAAAAAEAVETAQARAQADMMEDESLPVPTTSPDQTAVGSFKSKLRKTVVDSDDESDGQGADVAMQSHVVGTSKPSRAIDDSDEDLPAAPAKVVSPPLAAPSSSARKAKDAPSRAAAGRRLSGAQKRAPFSMLLSLPEAPPGLCLPAAAPKETQELLSSLCTPESILGVLRDMGIRTPESVLPQPSGASTGRSEGLNIGKLPLDFFQRAAAILNQAAALYQQKVMSMFLPRPSALLFGPPGRTREAMVETMEVDSAADTMPVSMEGGSDGTGAMSAAATSESLAAEFRALLCALVPAAHTEQDSHAVSAEPVATTARSGAGSPRPGSQGSSGSSSSGPTRPWSFRVPCRVPHSLDTQADLEAACTVVEQLYHINNTARIVRTVKATVCLKASQSQFIEEPTEPHPFDLTLAQARCIAMQPLAHSAEQGSKPSTEFQDLAALLQQGTDNPQMALTQAWKIVPENSHEECYVVNSMLSKPALLWAVLPSAALLGALREGPGLPDEITQALPASAYPFGRGLVLTPVASAAVAAAQQMQQHGNGVYVALVEVARGKPYALKGRTTLDGAPEGYRTISLQGATGPVAGAYKSWKHSLGLSAAAEMGLLSPETAAQLEDGLLTVPKPVACMGPCTTRYAGDSEQAPPEQADSKYDLLVVPEAEHVARIRYILQVNPQA